MPDDPFVLPRMTVAEIVEDLRDEAVDLAPDLKDIPAHETVYGQAAQTLEEFEAALTRIAEGAGEPQSIATEALSLSSPLRPIGDAEDTLRRLLKPRRE